MYVAGDGRLQYTKYYEAQGLPQEQWSVVWQVNVTTGERSVLYGPNDRPLFGCDEHPELGLYEIDPTTDLVMKVVPH